MADYQFYVQQHLKRSKWDNKDAVAKARKDFYSEYVTEGPVDNGHWIPRAEKAYRSGSLPSDFRNWDIRCNDARQTPLAHLAAKEGKLPEKFGQWAIRDGSGKTAAHVAAEFGTLPKSFKKWELTDSRGITVADRYREAQGKNPPNYEVEINRNFDLALAELRSPAKKSLPDCFVNWGLENTAKDKTFSDGGPDYKRTIAHYAAELGRLPNGFDQWDLKTAQGITVAHTAAFYGKLPKDFPVEKLYEKIDEHGNTLAHAAAKSGCFPDGFSDFELRNNRGETIYHKMTEGASWPAKFDKWDLADNEGTTVAHKMALRNPELLGDFKRYDLQNNHGVSVGGLILRDTAYRLSLEDGKTLNEMEVSVLLSKNGKDGGIFAHEFPHIAIYTKGHADRIDFWNTKDDNGLRVIDAARRCPMDPDSASRIEENYARLVANEMASSIHGAAPAPELSYKEAAQAMKDGTLPSDFNDWSKKNSDGWTLAHAAAALGKLPPDFKDWGMEGAKPGITVAHIAMRYSELPPSFNDWGIKDASGKTLGEVAVKHPKLGAEYQARIEASKQTQQPKAEARAPVIEAAKPSPEAQAQGGKNNQAAPVETSSTGRITGGGRFNRPPDLSKREPEPERRQVKAFISRGM